jgi:hypothetical protein
MSKKQKINREPLILLLGQLMLKTANPLTLRPKRLPKLGNILSHIGAMMKSAHLACTQAFVKNNI